ncbi:LarC family nickel insertion protein [Ancylobacter oerskovii]|uniref:LarC family nickel insertion protein n=1 Tax=Ancylobacter oerskovii TaxID=459519 RepID=A0ABW4YZ34_9HYPH|nr:LarC family nickel insertion protein [Ancylobacter oerskovii]MBS7541657.1 LarC family nickel insertion protein [Ancylobacter oerskovii]
MHIHLDPVGGIAGDMFVAALLAARPELEPRVLADVAAVLPPEAGKPRLADVVSGGIAARHFSLAVPGDAPSPPAGAAAGHSHEEGHPHAMPHHDGARHSSHATFAAMRGRIRAATLAPGTAEAAIGILAILAAAEARMHRMPVEEVHFHEIGDWDSLMDVVAAGCLIAALAPARWSVAPLPLGGGLVKTAHGLLPVPAPATVEILKGFDWRDDGIGGERVTPTGAAILRFVIGDEPASRPGIARPDVARLDSAGYGAGTRHLHGLPNVLRASLFTADAATDETRLLDIAFDIDDMTGEEMAQAADRLRGLDGVRDLRLTGAIGKKGRPVTTFSLLAEPAAFDAVGDAIFLETSTLGLRWHAVERRVLARDHDVTAGGQPVKRAHRPDGTRSAKVESDVLADIPTLAARRRLAKATD